MSIEDIPQNIFTKAVNLGHFIITTMSTLITNHNQDGTAHPDKEVKSNKVTSWSSTLSNDRYPSEKLVKEELDNKISSVNIDQNISDYNEFLDTNYSLLRESSEPSGVPLDDYERGKKSLVGVIDQRLEDRSDYGEDTKLKIIYTDNTEDCLFVKTIPRTAFVFNFNVPNSPYNIEDGTTVTYYILPDNGDFNRVEGGEVSFKNNSFTLGIKTSELQRNPYISINTGLEGIMIDIEIEPATSFENLIHFDFYNSSTDGLSHTSTFYNQNFLNIYNIGGGGLPYEIEWIGEYHD